MGASTRLGFLVVLLPIAMGGCAVPLPRPARLAFPWVEVSSEHFVLETDLYPDSAARMIEHFEAFRAALQHVTVPSHTAPALPSPTQPWNRTHFVVFVHEDPDVGSRGTVGYFIGLGTAEPRGVLYSGSRDFDWLAKAAVVDRYVASEVPEGPSFVWAGLLNFYRTVEAGNGNATFRSDPSPPDFLMATEFGKERPLGGPVEGTLGSCSRYVPPVAKLVRMSRREFYADDLDEADAVPLARKARFAAAWALIRVLVRGDPERHARFLAYLDLLETRTVPASEAWERTLRQDEPELDRAVTKLLAGDDVGAPEVDFVPPTPLAPRLRMMTPAEVHLLWAQVRAPSTARSRARSRWDIDVALRTTPDDPRALVLSGQWYWARGDLGRAEATFRRAVEVAPRSPETLHALANFLFTREEQKPPEARHFASVAPWVERLEPVANTPRQWNFIAWYRALRHEPARGLDVARRAVRERADCAVCYDTLALLLYEGGAVFDALEAQVRAVELSGIGDKKLVAQLELYDRDLRALKREVSPPPGSAPEVAVLGRGCEKPVATSTPAPPYPSRASMNYVEGVVRARFVVREDGSVTDVAALSGPAVLAAAAVTAIQSWRFSPAHCGPRAVASTEETSMPFVLANP